MWCVRWVLRERAVFIQGHVEVGGCLPGDRGQEKLGSCSSHAVNSPHWLNCLTGLICCACGLDKRSSCWKGLAQMHVDEAVDCQKDPSRFFSLFLAAFLLGSLYLRLPWSCIDQVNYFSFGAGWPACQPRDGERDERAVLQGWQEQLPLEQTHIFTAPCKLAVGEALKIVQPCYTATIICLSLPLSSPFNFAVNKAKSGVSRLHLSMHQPAMFFVWLCAVRVLLGMQRCSLSFRSQALYVSSWGEGKKKKGNICMDFCERWGRGLEGSFASRGKMRAEGSLHPLTHQMWFFVLK